MMKRIFKLLFSRNAQVLIVAVIALLCGMALALHHLLVNPKVILLLTDGAAQWIRADEPFNLKATFEQENSTAFGIKLNLPTPQKKCVLEVAALRRVEIDLDGHQIFDSGPVLEKWKTTYPVQLPDLAVGSHVLVCVVSNRGGPTLLRVNCPQLGIASDGGWLASVDRKMWRPAALATALSEPELSPELQLTFGKLIHMLAMPATVFVAALFFLNWYKTFEIAWVGRIRWLLLIGWVLLGVNNVFKTPLLSGYDAQAHYDYILFVAQNFSLPRPDGGWQYFQSPLYYIVSAGWLHLLLAMGINAKSALFLMRGIPMVSAALLVEISYHAGRLVFSNRADLQLVTLLVGGIAPVNLYMGQTVSNEPMAAAISACILLISLRFVVSIETLRSLKWLILAGAVLGLAVLTKIDTVPWCLPLGAAIAFALRRDKANWPRWIKAGSTVAGCALVISGWMMIRNFRLIGKPFYTEASVSSSQWWQDPGYRTPRMFYEFGHVFSRPVYNVMAGFWDSLYGTLWGSGIPSGDNGWNFELMWCGLWLAIVPTFAIGLGLLRAIIDPKLDFYAPGLRIAGLALGSFVAAIFYIYITLPVYCCGKSSYMMSITPCLGLLAATGYDLFSKNRLMRNVIGSVLICWAFSSYFTYFIFT